MMYIMLHSKVDPGFGTTPSGDGSTLKADGTGSVRNSVQYALFHNIFGVQEGSFAK